MLLQYYYENCYRKATTPIVFTDLIPVLLPLGRVECYSIDYATELHTISKNANDCNANSSKTH